MSIESRLDEAYIRAESEAALAISARLPNALVGRLRKWRYGAYGWISPVNLLITAAWYKWLNPQQDVCKIWATDHKSKPIPGGFAIRSNDEGYTVPLVSKTRIAAGFCSPNSGMQGSRALEKMRGAGRIDRDTPIDQSVSFDMPLFQNILNDINQCSSDEALDVLCLLLRIGIEIREEREAQKALLLGASVTQSASIGDVLTFARSISDPQFVRIIAAFFAFPFVSTIFEDASLGGMDGAKTAADSQSKSPGDFWFATPSGQVIGAEVKDKSKQIGFEILQAIEARKANNPKMSHYLAISAAPSAVSEKNLADPFWRRNVESLRKQHGVNVICLSLDELAGLFVLSGGSMQDFLAQVTTQLTTTIDLKQDTIASWQEEFLVQAV
ncbi:hypothetical protein [Tabrizicola sp.]|uniref:hypothetical protein n=1 Tax=Tabrizicola sp. TaxID=2005166 RepID=UPI00263042C7|nr:hypothetical protein [Tabrizicola sp.]MDM7930895.1 hypothetical protein [Tabrizicola sp.]